MKDPVIRFLENIHSQPLHPAVVQDSCTVNYKQIGELALRIGFAVSEICEQPRVLVHLQQGVDAYAAMFGVLIAGGYYSPTNMEAPTERHIEIIKLFKPDIILSTKKYVEHLPLAKMNVVFVDIDELPVTKLSEPLAPHDLAYVIFTSGSTGKPKGVMIPRDGLAHYVEWAINAMNITKKDRWSQQPNIAFDLSVLDIYGSLCGGATLYPLVSTKDRLLPANFIKRHQLTIWDSVPSVIDLMIRARQVTVGNFSSLRLLTFCGEPLLPRHLDAIFAANSDLMVHNTYGPTEATVSCTLIQLTADNYNDYSENSIALGSAIAGMELQLMNGIDKDEGEIVLSGPQLARGYWENNAETQKTFVEISEEFSNLRVCRTGDWAVRKGDQLYFKERIDTQVKVRGNRVELSEIDAAFFGLGFGNVCTVFVNDKLHSFLETESKLDEPELREVLAKRLPDYEIPDFMHSIKYFPRNNNDKIDRKQLIQFIGTDNKLNQKRGVD